MNKLPAKEELQALLDYDPDTGVLTWKQRSGKYASCFNRRYAGTPAGTLRSDGYIALKVKNVIYAAHRVIWAMVHDQWPECVRHINRDDADNRLDNLRAATRQEINHELALTRPPRLPANVSV